MPQRRVAFLRWLILLLLKEKRLPGLVAHAVFPISTGKLGGFNNKVKVAKRIGYGYRDDAYFFSLVRFLTWMA